MATFSAEQFTEFMALQREFEAARMQQTLPGLGRQASPQEPRQTFDVRNFHHTKVFDGPAEKWGHWSFSFKRIFITMCLGTAVTMEKIEKETALVDEDVDHEIATDKGRKASAELFNLLCTLTEGEALSIVIATEDRRGFLAWQRLHLKYNPKTMARALKLVSQVVNPPKIFDLRDVDMELAKWEDKVKKLGT